jgi:hypothetical protein
VRKKEVQQDTRRPQIIQDQQWWDEGKGDERRCVLEAEEGKLSGVQTLVEKR